MIKHTKGPWHVDNIKPDTECERDKTLYITADTDDLNFENYTSFYIAQTFGPDSEANARLISAAPDLFEACKYTLGHMLEQRIVQKNDALFSCISHLVNAISKAGAQ